MCPIPSEPVQATVSIQLPHRRIGRRQLVGWSAAALAAGALGRAGMALAAGARTPLEVAYAGSMGALMDGAIAPAAATALGIQMRGRGAGSTGLARLILAGAIRPDVFVSVTPGPMRLLLKAGMAKRALPIARTEMVIAYSPRSRFQKQFAQCVTPGATSWWKILQSPGLRFGRTDPLTDPQGLNILFTMELAERYYKQPGLMQHVLGAPINHAQIFAETQVMARLQAGQLDASSAYRTQPTPLGLPYVSLPAEINLGDAAMERRYREVSIALNGKSHQPAPLVFYAAALTHAAHPKLAERFVSWLAQGEGRAIMHRNYYEQASDAVALTA